MPRGRHSYAPVDNSRQLYVILTTEMFLIVVSFGLIVVAFEYYELGRSLAVNRLSVTS